MLVMIGGPQQTPAVPWSTVRATLASRNIDFLVVAIDQGIQESETSFFFFACSSLRIRLPTMRWLVVTQLA